jgi:hypothetical protein
MMIYNVTVKVEEAVHEAWLQWTRQILIPEVMATGLFLGWRLCRLEDPEEDPDPTYVLQYTVDTPENLSRYEKLHAPALRQMVAARFPTQCMAFRTRMTVIN